MYIYYSDTLDGRLSGYLVSESVKSSLDEKIFVPVQFGRPISIDGISLGDLVWVLDCNLSPAQMQELQNRGCDVVWIDHHESAIAEYIQNEGVLLEDRKGICQTGKSTCLLTWEYLHGTKRMPTYVQYVGEFSLWRSGIKNGIRDFQFALQNCTNLEPGVKENSWDWVSVHAFSKDDAGFFIEDLGGQVLRKDYVKRFREELDKYSFIVELGDNDVLVYNGKADLYGFRGYGTDVNVWAGYWFDGTNWIVEFYSDTVNVLEIAKLWEVYQGDKHIARIACSNVPFESAWMQYYRIATKQILVSNVKF